MSPEQIAAPGTEHAHQAALFCWSKQQISIWPQLEWMYAIPNGGKRDAITANRLKMEGVKSGVSDVCLPFPKRGYHGFYIEMKKPKSEGKAAGKESDEQKKFGKFLGENGFLYHCCWNWEEARDAIIWYMSEDV